MDARREGTIWLFEGFTVVMAAYWLFGFAHGQKTYNTSCLLERLCLILIYSQLRPVAIKVINTIKKTPVA
uniref:Putative secreted protein n=1 Tax=Ixodes scapularis TaxID=6945 RepID=A0A4D5RWB3_IXOSC